MRAALLIAAFGVVGCSGSLDTPNPGEPAAGSSAVGSGGTTHASGGANGKAGGGGGPGSGGTFATAGTGASSGGSANGSGGSGGGAGGTPSACAAEAVPDVGPSVLRRLSNLEYQLTLAELFKLETPPALEGIPGDALKDGFEIAATQAVSALHLRGYLEKATSLASDLLSDAARRAAVLGCEPSAPSCLESFVTSFGRLAYRRPLEATEVSAIVDAATEHAIDTQDQFRYAFEVLLTSPSFLFRVEVGNTPEGVSTLNGYELASRLSFALWGRSPSAALLDQAAAGALDSPGGLASAAQALLQDPRAHQFYGAFFRRWLGFELLREPVPPPSDWSAQLLPAMQAETDDVLADFAWQERNFLEVLTTSATRVSPALASFYGLPAPAAGGAVTIPANHVRAGTGLLTHASLLSAKRDGDLIAVRGNWLRNTFLCDHVTPIDLTAAVESLKGLTPVEIVKARNERGDCAGCHALLDPIGIAFSEFDQTGRYDDTLDRSVYGIATELPETPNPAFATLAELSQKLAALPNVTSCLSSRAFLYVNGREPDTLDACTVAQVSNHFASNDYGFATLLASLVESPAFRTRRAPAAP
jgi:hypothetical protein